MLGRPTEDKILMEKKPKAGRRKVISAFLLLFGPAFLLIFISTRSCEHKFETLDDFGKIVDYSFTDVNGNKITSRDLKGEVVIITTIQETCPDSCTISLWHLDQSIYQHIRKNKGKKLKKTRIISFVTDGNGNPVTDLSTVRQALEDNVEEYDPEIWMLASGDVRSVYNFKHKGIPQLNDNDEYLGGQGFQELLLLLDKQNHLRMVLPGSSEGMVRRMKQNIALLQKQYDKENAKKSPQK